MAYAQADRWPWRGSWQRYWFLWVAAKKGFPQAEKKSYARVEVIKK
jgi:hypothetical protein